jgi:hypothetical protein
VGATEAWELLTGWLNWLTRLQAAALKVGMDVGAFVAGEVQHLTDPTLA